MKEYICIRLILSLSAVQLCSEMNVAVLVWLGKYHALGLHHEFMNLL